MRQSSLCLLLAIVLSSGLPTEAATAWECDFNGDGIVDFQDYLNFTSFFGRNVDSPMAAWYDLDGSGRVGFADFLEFIAWYGRRSYDRNAIYDLSDIPDTLRIGSTAELSISVLLSRIRGDLITYRTDLHPQADSVTVTSVEFAAHYGDTLRSTYELKAAGQPGPYTLVVGVQPGVPASDSASFVVADSIAAP